MFAEVDAVTIATPNKFHAEISIAALNAGIHVLCEKPMAITTAECEAITEAANQSGKGAFHCLSLSIYERSPSGEKNY